MTAIAQTAEGSVLVAGIGNLFHGDDGFGVAVAQRMADRALPPRLVVRDFGIRGYDLALALADGYRATILVDAAPRGRAPGTLILIEPETLAERVGPYDPHAMTPTGALGLAAQFGAPLDSVYVVGCEPARVDAESVDVGLSPAVKAAVEPAIDRVLALASDILQSEVCDA